MKLKAWIIGFLILFFATFCFAGDYWVDGIDQGGYKKDTVHGYDFVTKHSFTGQQVATQPAPLSGYEKLYFKPDGILYQLTPAGVESVVGGAAFTPAALTKTDDTNVIVTLGGSPLTALLQPISLTFGWTGTLASSRGGSGMPSQGYIPFGQGVSGLDSSANLTWDNANKVLTLSGTIKGGSDSLSNTLLGLNALEALRGGAYNTVIGANSSIALIDGIDNVAIGESSFKAISHGMYDVVIGNDAMLLGTGTVNYETAIGFSALYQSNGEGNTAIGAQAGYSLTTGTHDVIIGYLAGQAYPITGSNDILIGYNITPSSDLSNFLNIGNAIKGDLSGTGKVGIALGSVDLPTNTLQVGDAVSSGWLVVISDGTTDLGLHSSSGLAEIGSLTNHPLVFMVNATERMRIDTSGGLTIGSLTGLLFGTAGAISTKAIGTDVQAYNSYLTGINQALDITASPTFANLVVPSITPAADFTLNQNSVAVVTSIASGAIVNTLYLSAGNVGIGGTNLKANFHIIGANGSAPSSAITPQLIVESSATAGVGVGPVLIFKGQTGNSTTPYDFAAIQGMKSSATAGNYSGDLAFFTQNAGGATLLTERMRITSGGAVLIGATAPIGSEKLMVSGDIAFNLATKGPVLKDTQSTPHYWRVTVSTLGVLTTTDLGTGIP